MTKTLVTCLCISAIFMTSACSITPYKSYSDKKSSFIVKANINESINKIQNLIQDNELTVNNNPQRGTRGLSANNAQIVSYKIDPHKNNQAFGDCGYAMDKPLRLDKSYLELTITLHEVSPKMTKVNVNTDFKASTYNPHDNSFLARDCVSNGNLEYKVYSELLQRI